MSNVQNLADWKPLVIDLGNTPTQNINLSYPLEKGDQVWLLGYYADNLSTPFVKVEIKEAGSNLCQATSINTANTGGAALFIAEPGTGAAPARRDLAVPQPVLDESHNPQRITRVAVEARSWADAAVTFTSLILFFAVSRQNNEHSVYSKNFPISNRAHDGYNQW